MNDSPFLRRILTVSTVLFLILLPNLGHAEQQDQSGDTASKDRPLAKRIWTGVEAEAVGIVKDALAIYTAPIRWDKQDWLIAGGFLAIAGAMYSQEQAAFDAIRDNRSDLPLQPAIKLGSNIEKSALKSINTGYFAGGMALGAMLGNEMIYEISIGTLEAYLIGGVTQQVVWNLTGRARPQAGDGPYTFHQEKAHSMFSGHASNAFIIATVVSMNVDWLPAQVAAWTYATTIGLQRIAYDKHWPSDVFVGAVHGVVIARAVVLHRQQRTTALHVQPTLLGDRGTPGIGLSYRF